VPGLREYHVFLDDLEAEMARIESLRVSGTARSCPVGCSDCCLPFTLLPLEAHAILSQSELPRQEREGAVEGHGSCAFLSPAGVCAIYDARPFICRTRGYPVLHLNCDGEWESDGCAKRGFLVSGSKPVGLALETWNARLFRLNEDFCAWRGLSPSRLRIADLLFFQNAAVSPVGR
jgi:Putative zinc- or iron-chelating domain